MLYPYINDIILSDAKQPFDQQNFNSVVKSAVICTNGKLTSNFEYITELRKRKAMNYSPSSEKKKQVLVLGKNRICVTDLKKIQTKTFYLLFQNVSSFNLRLRLCSRTGSRISGP